VDTVAAQEICDVADELAAIAHRAGETPGPTLTVDDVTKTELQLKSVPQAPGGK